MEKIHCHFLLFRVMRSMSMNYDLFYSIGIGTLTVVNDKQLSWNEARLTCMEQNKTLRGSIVPHKNINSKDWFWIGLSRDTAFSSKQSMYLSSK